jgi:hypothetical protein
MTIEVNLADTSPVKYNFSYYPVSEYLKIIDGTWGLVEFPFSVKSENDKLQLNIWNSEFHKKDTLLIDELLIREKGQNLYRLSDSTLIINGRYYPL